MESSLLRMFNILLTLLMCQLIYQNSSLPLTKTLIFFVIFVMFSIFYEKTKQPVPNAPLPPGPTPWPLVGCLPSMWRNKPAYRWIHLIMKQFDTEIACIRLGKTHVISVTSPELAVEFLKTHDSAFASRPTSMVTNMLSHGFLSAAFTPWGVQQKKMRRILTSEILSPSRLHSMLGERTDEADILLRYIFSLIASRTSTAVINLRSITQHYCGNIIRRMLFSRRYYNTRREDGGPTSAEEEHMRALFTILLHINAFSVSDFMPFLQPLDLDGHKKIVTKALELINKYDEPIIYERLQQWKDGKRKKPEDILDLFISLKNENGSSLLSIKEIKAQITELQLGTVDNPSNAVEWAMAEMLNQPKILQKAVEELDRVVGKDRLVQESDIPKLKYIMACARESFRLHPLSPFNVPHVSNSDMVVGGYFIPKGSQILLSRLGLGRNPRIWEDPMKFDPERHLKNETIDLGLSEPHLRFITFSRGRRGCLGSSLGTNLTIMLFARLLQGFSWSLPPGMMKIDLSESNHLFIVNPLHLCAQPRLPHFMYSI